MSDLKDYFETKKDVRMPDHTVSTLASFNEFDVSPLISLLGNLQHLKSYITYGVDTEQEWLLTIERSIKCIEQVADNIKKVSK